MMKICSKCKKEKDNSEFGRNTKNKRGFQYDCKDCHSSYDKKRNIDLRQRVINHYGNECSCCSEINLEFLSLHHMNGNGRQHRLGLKVQGNNFYKWIEKNEYPKEFGILCHNCNMSYGLYGYCPHKRRE